MAGFLEVDLAQHLDHVEIAPLSDVHPGDPLFKEGALDGFLRWVLTDPHRYVVLNGDILNVATKTSVSDVYGSRMTPGEELRYMTDKLRPLADSGRLLASTQGNHEYRITKADGIDPAEVLANNLGVPYFREGVLLFVKVGKASRTTGRHDAAPVCYSLYFTHGSAGGRRAGGKANRLEEMSLNIEGADAIVVGHTHQAMVLRNSVNVVDAQNKRLVPRDRLYINAGSFLEWGGYAEVAGFIPGSTTMPVLELSGSRKAMRTTI